MRCQCLEVDPLIHIDSRQLKKGKLIGYFVNIQYIGCLDIKAFPEKYSKKLNFLSLQPNIT